MCFWFRGHAQIICVEFSVRITTWFVVSLFNSKAVMGLDPALLKFFIIKCCKLGEIVPKLGSFIYHDCVWKSVQTGAQLRMIDSQTVSVDALGRKCAAEKRVASSTIRSSVLPSKYILSINARKLNRVYSLPIVTRKRKGEFLVLWQVAFELLQCHMFPYSCALTQLLYVPRTSGDSLMSPKQRIKFQMVHQIAVGLRSYATCIITVFILIECQVFS